MNYEQYAEQSGLTILEVKQAVKHLFSDHRRQAIRHEPKELLVGKKAPQVDYGTCGIITASGRKCTYPARYDDGMGSKVCGIHRPTGYNMSTKQAA